MKSKFINVSTQFMDLYNISGCFSIFNLKSSIKYGYQINFVWFTEVDVAIVMEDVAAEAAVVEPVEEAETTVGETDDVVFGVLLEAQCKQNPWKDMFW